MAASIEPGSLPDRAVGCLLGCAIGDALGTTNEFVERWRLNPITHMVGGGALNRQPGEWTDDTAMALALADSLLHYPDLDEADFLDRLVCWFRQGRYSCVGKCDDIGLLTRKALTRWMFERQLYPSRTDRLAAGNGSLVRMAPVAIRFKDSRLRLHDAAVRQSRCTHGCSEALNACTAFGDLLLDALAGAGKLVLAPRTIDAGRSVTALVAGSWRGKPRSWIRSTGYVIHTLEAALWCVGHNQTFEATVLDAANLGGDADTIAAVAGQLAGAIYGASAIPETLKQPIAWRHDIELTALKLLSF